jgi:hypothetical protein
LACVPLEDGNCNPRLIAAVQRQHQTLHSAKLSRLNGYQLGAATRL